ncbi:hypothetical protein [Amycolatopsis circi]|uniref:hypothetical protein n=1 Tax=Amycolatopsis circi TaxID=871959 RepID=UPI0013BEA010|nr:hypothetical protein [Amycolatopsis circi]
MTCTRAATGVASPAEAADEYARCLGWARMHLRLAETVAVGAAVSTAEACLRHEAYQWREFLDYRRAYGRSA